MRSKGSAILPAEGERRKVHKGAESNYVTRSTCLKLIGHLPTTPVLHEGWNTS